MPTIEARTIKDGKTVYRVKVRRKGALTHTATFARLTDARKWAQMTEVAILEGRHFKKAEAKRHTLADAVDRYLHEVLPSKSESSIYMQTLQLAWWKAQLGAYPLADLTPALIAEYRDKLARGDDKPRANSTVNRYLAALSHTLTTAVKEWGWLDDSPLRLVRKPKEPRGRVRFLSDDERTRVLDACKGSTNPYLYTVVILALATGARKMEILRLTWRDVDLQRGMIILQDTKNRERRTLPLTGYALELMRQHGTTRRTETDLVFPGPTGKKPLGIRDAWKNAVTRAGLVDFRFHDLRHSAASYLAMNGASLMEIADLLGHKSLSMVKRYAHLSDAHTASVVARMNAKIFRVG
jgi:integrase